MDGIEIEALYETGGYSKSGYYARGTVDPTVFAHTVAMEFGDNFEVSKVKQGHLRYVPIRQPSDLDCMVVPSKPGRGAFAATFVLF